MATIKTLDQIFNIWFDRTEEDISIATEKMDLGFDCKVIISRNIPPRDERFDYICDVGGAIISDIFGKQEQSLEGSLLFVFPERHMSVHEQRSFMCQIEDHKNRKNLKEVCLITSSALIISAFVKECITIISSPEYMGN